MKQQILLRFLGKRQVGTRTTSACIDTGVVEVWPGLRTWAVRRLEGSGYFARSVVVFFIVIALMGVSYSDLS